MYAIRSYYDVGGCSCPALEHIDRELFVQFAAEQFVAGIANGMHAFFADCPEFIVCHCGSFFDHSQTFDQMLEIFDEYT